MPAYCSSLAVPPSILCGAEQESWWLSAAPGEGLQVLAGPSPAGVNNSEVNNGSLMSMCRSCMGIEGN